MGPYCRFCDNRCFVERVIPNGLVGGGDRRLLMATCLSGSRYDREKTGYDYSTAINPFERKD